MRKPHKPKAFRASKEVKRRARLRVGSPPPARRQEGHKHKPPKHQKREMEITSEVLVAEQKSPPSLAG
jgi:hypothetical protein